MRRQENLFQDKWDGEKQLLSNRIFVSESADGQDLQMVRSEPQRKGRAQSV